jgi:hypothetical protein
MHAIRRDEVEISSCIHAPLVLNCDVENEPALAPPRNMSDAFNPRIGVKPATYRSEQDASSKSTLTNLLELFAALK